MRQTMETPETIELGRTGLRVSALGVGTNTWGSRGGADPNRRSTFDALLDAGITLLDTAEIYTGGESERTVGRCIRESGRSPLVLTKFFPMPWRMGKGALRSALRRSLSRLGLSTVDVYLLHFPWPPVPVETWAHALADAVEAGLARAAGISNCDPAQTRRAHAVLAARGIPLACNEVELSLLQRRPEHSGLLEVCRELGVTVIAYRPLALGTLSGKYDAAHRPGGYRGLVYGGGYLSRIQPVLAALNRIAEARGKTVPQVALNWILFKGSPSHPRSKEPRPGAGERWRHGLAAHRLRGGGPRTGGPLGPAAPLKRARAEMRLRCLLRQAQAFVY